MFSKVQVWIQKYLNWFVILLFEFEDCTCIKLVKYVHHLVLKSDSFSSRVTLENFLLSQEGCIELLHFASRIKISFFSRNDNSCKTQQLYIWCRSCPNAALNPYAWIFTAVEHCCCRFKNKHRFMAAAIFCSACLKGFK